MVGVCIYIYIYLFVVSVGGSENVSFAENGWSFAASDRIYTPAVVHIVHHMHLPVADSAERPPPERFYFLTRQDHIRSKL